MLKIIAIGGGEIRTCDTLALDRRACDLTGKRVPAALFLPTASNDPEGYIQTFTEIYGNKLGCRVRVLCLSARPSHTEIIEKVRGADLIYVGGGNTLGMMRTWRRAGLDVELARASRRDTVLCGVSAGAICWFRFGHSDSRSFSDRKDWNYIRVRGLSLVPLLFCPHYRSKKENRERSLRKMLSARGGRAVACDDLAALEIVGDTYRTLSVSKDAETFFLRRVRGRVVSEPLAAAKDYRPLTELTGVSC